jgi:prolyl 4-hydroxylase
MRWPFMSTSTHLLLLFFFTRQQAPSLAFTSPQPQRCLEFPRYTSSSSFSTSLAARKKGIRRTQSAGGGGGGGGFGSSSNTKPSKSVNDVASSGTINFPPLEPQIRATLIPSSDESIKTPGPLSLEILDRLDQIYGFPNFNNRQVRKQNESSLASLLALEQQEDENSEDSTLNSSQRQMQQAIRQIPPFTDFKVLHVDPLVLSVDNFMTAAECQAYRELVDAAAYTQQSPTVGTGKAARAQRTSTTWYHSYDAVPAFVTKACALLGLSSVDAWEEAQLVRYKPTEHFNWHLDALPPHNLPAAGQRIATLLVYLTDNVQGGATIFRDLDLEVAPRQGSALLFFPAAGNIPGTPTDYRTLHAGQAVAETSPTEKWIGQLWLRSPGPYHVTVGTPHDDPIVASSMAAYAQQFATHDKQ